MALRLSPGAYRRVTLAALGALVVIIVTGTAVRLTGSGLGCPDWPVCERGRLVAPWEYHAMVEFVNRVFTGVVSLTVAAAVLGSLARVPRRRDLTRLSLGLVAGVAAQVVLGGLTVLFHLSPPLVMAHFLVSMVLVADATVLHHRARLPDHVTDDGARPGAAAHTTRVAPPEVGAMANLQLVTAALVLFTGTLVTASGPHGGDELAERLPLELPAVARLHGAAVVLLAAMVLASLWLIRRTGAPERLWHSGRVLLAVLAAQAAVGYTQYFTGVPQLLVAVHVIGATAVWIAVLHHRLVLDAPVSPAPRADARVAGGHATGSGAPPTPPEPTPAQR